MALADCFVKETPQKENLTRRKSAIGKLEEFLDHEKDFHQGAKCIDEWFWIFIWGTKYKEYISSMTSEFNEYKTGRSLGPCSWNIQHLYTDCVTAELELMVINIANSLRRCRYVSAKLKNEYKLIMVKVYLQQVGCRSKQCIEDFFHQICKTESEAEIKEIIEKNVLKKEHKIAMTSTTLWGSAPGTLASGSVDL